MLPSSEIARPCCALYTHTSVYVSVPNAPHSVVLLICSSYYCNPFPSKCCTHSSQPACSTRLPWCTRCCCGFWRFECEYVQHANSNSRASEHLCCCTNIFQSLRSQGKEYNHCNNYTMPRHAVVILDGGVSSRLEETVGRPLHPQLWSAGEVLTAEGRAAIVVSIKTAP